MSTIKTTNITHGSNSGTANLALTSAGNVTVGADLIATKQNGCQRIVLEEFGSPCDGSVIATSNGDITFPNVTASQTNTSSYVDVTGSSIAYNPPTGTTQVHYQFDYFTAEVDEPQLAHWKFFLDSDEVTKARRSTRFTNSWAGLQTFRWIFNIGGSADTTVGRVASWSSSKTMKLQWREYSGSYNPKLHETVYWDGGSATHLAIPTLSIKAIG